jgi:hypothetical protein
VGRTEGDGSGPRADPVGAVGVRPLGRWGAVAATYRRGLRTPVAAAAAPYGYTLTIWTSGAVIAHERGIPSAVGAILFAVGGVAGFALVGLLAYGGLGRRAAPTPAPFSLWHGLHVAGVGAAIGIAVAATAVVDGDAAWAVGGFLATVVYLLAAGLPHAFGPRPERDDEPRG